MNDSPPIRLGTRGSDLALWQAETVRDLLSREAPMREVEIITVKTLGDRVQDRKIEEIGRTAVFTAELDRALLDDQVDIGVHSLKDVETTMPDGVALACVIPRGPVEDVVVGAASLAELPAGARVGTGSIRRIAQVSRAHPGLSLQPIRGNVPTRLEKLDRGDYDALLMARAGLVRLGLGHRIGGILPADRFYHAVGQGAVAVTCREGDAAMLRILGGLNHAATWHAVRAERACLKRIGGGCNVPLGVFLGLEGETLRFRAGVYSPDGKQALEVDERFSATDDPVACGERVAEILLERGAADLF
ncbi:MAG: hydroxymethylbilane synthase [Planctomycetes bacterium]|nr:hydroxymethylbilane synthase [Planctomycetota bacterium]